MVDIRPDNRSPALALPSMQTDAPMGAIARDPVVFVVDFFFNSLSYSGFPTHADAISLQPQPQHHRRRLGPAAHAQRSHAPSAALWGE